MQLAFHKTNPCSRIRAYACSKPPVRRIELFPSFGIRLFPFPFTLFRYINPKRRKNFTKRRLTKFFRRFIFPKRRLRRRLMVSAFFILRMAFILRTFNRVKGNNLTCNRIKQIRFRRNMSSIHGNGFIKWDCSGYKSLLRVYKAMSGRCIVVKETIRR